MKSPIILLTLLFQTSFISLVLIDSLNLSILCRLKMQSLDKLLCVMFIVLVSLCVCLLSFGRVSVSESVQGVMICPLLAVSIRGPLEFSQNALCSDRACNVDWASALTWPMRSTCCQRASQPISWSSPLGSAAESMAVISAGRVWGCDNGPGSFPAGADQLLY